MSNFCSNCAASLEADARFCPSCSAPVAAVGATVPPTTSQIFTPEMRAQMQSGVRELWQPQSVPPPVWAGVISAFWVAATAFSLLVYSLGLAVGGVGAAMSRAAGSLPFGMGGGANVVAGEIATVAMIAVFQVFLCLVQLSLQVPLAAALFKRKQWAYGLFMIALVPLILQVLVQGVPPLSLLPLFGGFTGAFFGLVSWILGFALVFLQFMLIRRNKQLLVN